MIPSNYPPDPLLSARGTFVYRVDNLTRDDPLVQLGDGSGSGEWRDISLAVYHPDAAGGGRADVVGMLVWGDVDPNSHPRIASIEGNSAVLPYVPKMPIVLSVGAGTKTINVRIIFASGRTVESSVTHSLTDGAPHISILRQPKNSILLASDTVSFAWSCSHSASSYTVCVAPSSDATLAQSSPIVGGTNVSGLATAGAMVQTSFGYSDALAASKGAGQLSLAVTGQTFIKVFAVTTKGTTS